MEKETYDLMKRHGFTEDNSIFASVHSHPDDVLEILALILLVVQENLSLLSLVITKQKVVTLAGVTKTKPLPHMFIWSSRESVLN